MPSPRLLTDFRSHLTQVRRSSRLEKPQRNQVIRQLAASIPTGTSTSLSMHGGDSLNRRNSDGNLTLQRRRKDLFGRRREAFLSGPDPSPAAGAREAFCLILKNVLRSRRFVPPAFNGLKPAGQKGAANSDLCPPQSRRDPAACRETWVIHEAVTGRRTSKSAAIVSTTGRADQQGYCDYTYASTQLVEVNADPCWGKSTFLDTQNYLDYPEPCLILTLTHSGTELDIHAGNILRGPATMQ
ncbi:hypothetical protein Bbelb_222240 [Branchiostoma belcheri]|nr:hypothetical protein Bbelb_222240 [Branchiostoma belcheri]